MQKSTQIKSKKEKKTYHQGLSKKKKTFGNFIYIKNRCNVIHKQNINWIIHNKMTFLI